MIVDSLDNIEQYSNYSKNIYTGLRFIKEARPGIDLGIHDVNKHIFATVSEYDTIECFERGYEAHRYVIDIQYPIIGIERVKWSPLEGMDINIPYDSKKDRAFYVTPSKQGISVDIGCGIFAIMFPKDAHSPQHYIGKSKRIKKITIKIKM